MIVCVDCEDDYLITVKDTYSNAILWISPIPQFLVSLKRQCWSICHPDHGNSKCYTVLKIKWNKSSCLWYSYNTLRTLSCTSLHNRTIRFYFNQSSFLQLSMWFLFNPLLIPFFIELSFYWFDFLYCFYYLYWHFVLKQYYIGIFCIFCPLVLTLS